MPNNTLIESAKNVILTEAQAIADLANQIDDNFVKSCKLIQECQGKVILMGMGKSGHIGNKIAATLASTGTPSFTIHPSEAGHGDLGMITNNDVVIAISYSGESNEIIAIMPIIKRLGAPIIAMTGNKNSSIAKICSAHLNINVKKEACPHNLTPTSSTTATLAMGDAIAISLLIDKGFSPDDFARSHPSGALGRRLLTLIGDIMKTGEDIPQVDKNTKLLDALKVMSEKALGMLIIVDKDKLLGIFTDGDLRRVLEDNSDIKNILIKQVMRINCKSIGANKPATVAIQIMDKFNINSMPVVDVNNKVIGAINTNTLIQEKII